MVVHAYNPSTGDSWGSLVRQPRLLNEFQTTTERSVTSPKTGIQLKIKPEVIFCLHTPTHPHLPTHVSIHIYVNCDS